MADPYLRIHAVNIYVKDQARSLDFYLNKLGFHIAFDARVGSGERLLAVAPPDGSAVLTLIEAKPDTPTARLVGRATQVVFVTEDLPATYAEWRRRGVRSETRHASGASSTIGRAMQPIPLRCPRQPGRTDPRGAASSRASRTSIATRSAW